jgi:prepilin-type processing-associated H-X9-DG protein
MTTKRETRSGLTLVEAMIMLAVITILLFGYLLPRMARAKSHSFQISCANQLKSIGLSFRQWALDNNDEFPMGVWNNSVGAKEWAQQGIAWRVFQVMSNELNSPKILFCPADSNTNRTQANTFGAPVPGRTTSQISFTNNQNLSYFVNIDANQTATNHLLTGDSHFEAGGRELTEGLQMLSSSQIIGWAATRHENRNGNLCFADGSVRPFTSKKLPAALKSTGLATNRLAIP